MKQKHFGRLLMLLLASVVLLQIPAQVNAQNRTSRARTTKSRTVTKRAVFPKKPDAPAALSQQERPIKDLLFYPYGCLHDDVDTEEKAKAELKGYFGVCENINSYTGLHQSDAFDFTYRGVPIGITYYDWIDHRQWYCFYFDTRAEALTFYNNLVSDIKGVGIPLTSDKIYGGMSNRNRPISIFKWVYVSTPEKVKEASTSNIDLPEVVGKFKVELGVYKRKLQR